MSSRLSRPIQPGMLRFSQVYFVLADYYGRVGAGPFPSELLDEMGVKLTQSGQNLESSPAFEMQRRCQLLYRNQPHEA